LMRRQSVLGCMPQRSAASRTLSNSIGCRRLSGCGEPRLSLSIFRASCSVTALPLCDVTRMVGAMGSRAASPLSGLSGRCQVELRELTSARNSGQVPVSILPEMSGFYR
jgi:hypothetical protein